MMFYMANDNPKPRRMRLARLLRGLAQREVADESGIAENSISRYESGSRVPKAASLRMLATIYGKPVEWFYGEEQDDDPGQSSIEADRELVMNEASLALRSTGKELSDEAIRSIADFIRFVHEKERRESESGS